MEMPTATALAAARPACNSIEVGSSPILTALCVALASCAGLMGCASGTKNNTIPSGGPTMAEIYRQHMAGLHHDRQRSAPLERDVKPQRSPEEDPPDPGSYQLTVATGIDNRFARLPNPDLGVPRSAGSGPGRS